MFLQVLFVWILYNYGTSLHAKSCFMEHLKAISTEANGRGWYCIYVFHKTWYRMQWSAVIVLLHFTVFYCFFYICVVLMGFLPKTIILCQNCSYWVGCFLFFVCVFFCVWNASNINNKKNISIILWWQVTVFFFL